ncbi:glycosyltransferase family 4 protein [Corynebacterium mayonis]|uniref:glycosyltransferase family 4 protein n=1 Tax=Corynebacterium mayonis TaxID=3062461 RepID=UPI00313FE9D8
MRALFPLKLVVVLLTSTARLGMENPELLAEKIRERLRQSGVRVPFASPNKSQGNETEFLRTAFEKGDLGFLASRRLTFSQWIRTRSRALPRVARQTLEVLRMQIYPGVVGGRNSAIRPLFMLTNSLPHTTSGYTFRSQGLLQALSDEGIKTLAATRYAYPLVVGRFPGGDVERVGDVEYCRQIPWIYRSSMRVRIEKSARMLADLARENEATILHTTTDYKNALVVSKAARELGIPWVYEVRGEPEKTWLSRQPKAEQPLRKASDYYRGSRARETFAMQQASGVVVLSEVSRENLVERGVDPKKIVVVPNAVEAKYVGMKCDRRGIRTELGLAHDVTWVGSISSLVQYEGFDDLIRAVAQVSDVFLLIVGEGVDRPRLENLVDRLNVADRVKFVGKQPNESIWKWYACLDAFVVPRKDTEVCRTVTPIKPLMAQALGIPVIASDLPALREITGGLATYHRPESVEDLARVLRGVESNPAQDQRSIEWALKHTWQANATKLVEMYQRLLSSSPPDLSSSLATHS